MATARAQLLIFRDRRDAGRALAAVVRGLRLDDPVVLGLPRGGVPVAYEVALALEAPLDVLVARKMLDPRPLRRGLRRTRHRRRCARRPPGYHVASAVAADTVVDASVHALPAV